MIRATTRSVGICLVCDTLPEVPQQEGDVDVGLQDKSQDVHAGRRTKAGSLAFECDVAASTDPSTGALSLRGPFVHGTPDARFLYLSCKRRAAGPAPWVWRLKVPLSGITAAAVAGLQPGDRLVADITGHRPHAREVVVWRRLAAGDG